MESSVNGKNSLGHTGNWSAHVTRTALIQSLHRVKTHRFFWRPAASQIYTQPKCMFLGDIRVLPMIMPDVDFAFIDIFTVQQMRLECAPQTYELERLNIEIAYETARNFAKRGWINCFSNVIDLRVRSVGHDARACSSSLAGRASHSCTVPSSSLRFL